VASDTRRAGSLEYATGVTSLAGDPDMCAVERKAGTKMIEGLLGAHIHRNEKKRKKDGNRDAMIRNLR
jgi:hypothetical protein